MMGPSGWSLIGGGITTPPLLFSNNQFNACLEVPQSATLVSSVLYAISGV